MKKRILALLLAAAVALPLCACAPAGEEAEDGRLQVVCSLFPYYDFVREIGGAYVSPRLLVAAGREAHSFEPTPMDVIRVSRADVFVYNGGEGEQWVDEILFSAGENIPTVLRMMDYADTLTEEPLAGRDDHDHADHDHEHDDDHDSDDIEYDEHIWTSPVQAMKLCRAICDALCAADPAHAAVYRSNLENYLGSLRSWTWPSGRCAARKSAACWCSATASPCSTSVGSTGWTTARRSTAAPRTRSRPSTP